MDTYNDDMIRRYLKDIEKYPLIDAKRERELSKIIQEGKNKKEIHKAVNELVTSNLRIVVKIATKFYQGIKNYPDIRLAAIDIIQIGNQGLYRAAELFDYKRKFRFCTYAVTSVMRHIYKEIKETRMIRLPWQYYDYMRKLSELENGENGAKIKLSKGEQMEKLNISEYVYNILNSNKQTTVYLEDLAFRNNDEESNSPCQLPKH